MNRFWPIEVGWSSGLVQVEFRHGSSASAHGNPSPAGVGVAACTRCVHPRPVPAPVHRGAPVCAQCSSAMARASAALVDFDAFAQSGGGPIARTIRLASFLPVAPTLAWGANAARVSAADWRERTAPDQSTFAGAPAPLPRGAAAHGRADGRDRSAGGLQRLQKKTPARTPPCTRRWAGARSRRGKAAGLSVTRNTPCVCGCPRLIGR